MIYTNSKGEKKLLSEMNVFELQNSAQKADRLLNSFNGQIHKIDYDTGIAVRRFIEIVRDNLWAEVKGRDVTGIDEDFHRTFPHLNKADAVALKNFIKTNFTLKQ